jgi:ABC-type antimicrobial peptide transport system permease subunit
MEPAITVAAIMIFGMVAGLLAVRQISGMKLIDSLRAE